jgi:serine/threonine protein kinase
VPSDNRPTSDETVTRTSGDPGSNDERTRFFGRQRLGDFELRGEIGRGGMGIVYEAEQLSLRRKVALKILPPGLGLTPQAVERFEREARAAAKLHHTNIVPVYAIGAAGGCSFYAMELVEGQSLSAILADLRAKKSSKLLEVAVTVVNADAPARPIEAVRSGAAASLSETSSGTRAWFEAAAKLLADVAEALHYAHRQGIVHRDVKPSNLLLSLDGRLCLTDFGLAQIAQEPGMTTTGSLLGTPAYMSPEQIGGGHNGVDHRTDVYSLGAVLYEVLTLKRPFEAERLEEVLTAVLTQEPKAPRRLNPRVPADLETICLKALEKNPANRYRTAAELAADLRAYGQHGLISAKRAGPLKRTAKWMRRHPVASLAAAAATALAILSVVAVELSASRSQAEVRRLLAESELHWREGTFRDGLAKADDALALAPDSVDAERARARLFLEEGRLRDLANIAQRILAGHPDDWEAHAWTAFAGSGESDSDRLADIPVAEHVAAVSRLAPDTVDVWYLKGLIAVSHHEAVRCFDRALELDPGHAWARYGRAMANRTLCKFPEALADLEFVTAVRPKSARGRLGIADVYAFGMHDPERALVECEKAAAIDPRDPFVYHKRGQILGVLGQGGRQLEDFTKAVELAPRSALLRSLRAGLLAGSDESIADAKLAVEIEPNLPRAQFALLQGLWWGGRHREAMRSAIEDWRARADRWPDRRAAAWSYIYLALNYQRLGDTKNSVAVQDYAAETAPDYLDGFIETRIRDSRDGKKAIETDCDAFARLELDEPRTLASRAHELVRLCARLEPALADYERAIAMAPTWADAYAARSRDLRENGGFREALADAGRAVELAPKWPGALFQRALAYAALDRWPDVLSDLDHVFALGFGGGFSPGDARRLQASALAHLGREEDALAALDKSHRVRALLLLKLGRIDEALAAADQAVEARPDDSWSYTTRASILAYIPGGCERAEADLAQLKRLEGEVLDLGVEVLDARLRHLASSCPKSIQPAESLESAEAFANGWPGWWYTRFDHGLALYWSGRLEEAKAEFEAALAFPTIGENLRGFEYPTIPWEDAAPRFWLAITEAKLGRTQEARRVYNVAVLRMRKTWPKSIELVRLKTEAERSMGLAVVR